MKTRRNPAFKPVAFELPKFAETKAPKVDPEAGLPWRMWEQPFPTICKNHPTPVKKPASFVVARSRASADAVFAKGNGLCPTCMCRVLLNPRERIRTVDGGRPNPAYVAAPVSRERRPASPWRLFSFARSPNKPIRCACGKDRFNFFVIAKDEKEAAKRVDHYGMCALCMCEYLTFDRFIIETVDGGPP